MGIGNNENSENEPDRPGCKEVIPIPTPMYMCQGCMEHFSPDLIFWVPSENSWICGDCLKHHPRFAGLESNFTLREYYCNLLLKTIFG